MRRVAIAGVGMTRFGKLADRSLRSLAVEAATAAALDAGIDIGDVDYVFFANALGGLIGGQEMIRGEVALRELGFAGKPVFNVENACASGASALHLAVNLVGSGASRCALVIGAEKMTGASRGEVFRALAAGMDLERAAEELPGDLADIVRKRSPFVDLYASTAATYLGSGAATIEDLAGVSAKNHRNGALNEKAQYGLELRAVDVLESPVIVEPLTLLMCAPIGDGAAAAVIRPFTNGTSARAVPVLASEVVSSATADGRSAQEEAARQAYRDAGIRPTDLDFAEVHDATAIAELLAYEELGLVERGGGGRLLRTGTTGLRGATPVNPSGGLLSKGHPIGATGLAQIVEAVQQLRGEAGARQVARARIGLTANQGGWMSGSPAVAAVHVLGGR